MAYGESVWSKNDSIWALWDRMKKDPLLFTGFKSKEIVIDSLTKLGEETYREIIADYAATEQRITDHMEFEMAKKRIVKRTTTSKKPKELPPGTYTGRIIDHRFGAPRFVISGAGTMIGNNYQPGDGSKPIKTKKDMLERIAYLEKKAQEASARHIRELNELTASHEKVSSALKLAHATTARDYIADTNRRLLDILEAGSRGESFPRS